MPSRQDLHFYDFEIYRYPNVAKVQSPYNLPGRPGHMSRSICLRCLSRPLALIEQPLLRQQSVNVAQTTAFTTSSQFQKAAAPPKKKGAVIMKKAVGGTSYRQGRQTAKKTRAAGGGRPPASGERKALRKRIILSNTNALEVAGMEDFSNVLPTEKRHTQVLGFTDGVVDSLRAIEAFKATQGWSMFRRPATLVRKETVEMARYIEEVSDGRSTVRRVIHGEKGSGKSVLTLQAMAMSFLKGWIVFHIPEG